MSAQGKMVYARIRRRPGAMKIFMLVIGLSGMIGLNTQAFATLTCGVCPAPTATVTIGNAAPINVPVVPTGGTFSITSFTTTIAGVGRARIDALSMDPDPLISFTIGAINFSQSPLLFAFTFTEPITIPGNAIDAAASLAIDLIDGGGPGAASPSVTLVPSPGGKIMISNDLNAPGAATNKSIDVGNAVSGGTAPCAAFVLGTSTCTPFVATHTFAQNPSAPFVVMATTVSFELSASDGADLRGSVQQVPTAATPEPTTLLLMGSGLAGLGAWRRYRKSR